MILVAVGSAAAAVLLIIASATVVIVVIYVYRHQQGKVDSIINVGRMHIIMTLFTADDQKHHTEKTQSAMVPNPIYEGPIYETIQPQTFDSLAANKESDSVQERESRYYLDNPIFPAESGEANNNTGITDSVVSTRPACGNDNYTVMSPIGSLSFSKLTHKN